MHQHIIIIIILNSVIKDILVGMLKKEKKRAADADTALKQAGRGLGDTMSLGTRRSASQPSASDDSESDVYNYSPVHRTHGPERASSDTHEVS